MNKQKNATICVTCDNKLSARSERYCEYHLGYHAGYQAVSMKLKRNTNERFAEQERHALKIRMRKLRASRRQTLVAH